MPKASKTLLDNIFLLRGKLIIRLRVSPRSIRQGQNQIHLAIYPVRLVRLVRLVGLVDLTDLAHLVNSNMFLGPGQKH